QLGAAAVAGRRLCAALRPCEEDARRRPDHHRQLGRDGPALRGCRGWRERRRDRPPHAAAVGQGHGARKRPPDAPLPDRARGSAHRRLRRGDRGGRRRRSLPRSRRPGCASDHARHSEPASPQAHGMGAALAYEHPRRDRSAGGVLILIEVRVPDEQEGTKAVVRAWLKQVGDAVAENDPLVELETDKVTQEVPAPAAGVLAEILLDTDAEAVPGALLARIETGSPAKAGAQEAKPEVSASGKAAAHAAPGPRPSPGYDTENRLSPSVRRACLQNGIDPSRIQGTGRNGRVTRDDVDRAVASATVVSVGKASTAQPRQFAPQDIPHDRMRLTIAENMVRAVR